MPENDPTALQVYVMQLQEAVDRLLAIDERLGDPDKMTDAGRKFRAEEVQRQLVVIRDLASDLARSFGLQAILDGDLSRKRVAELQSVHQMTVGRWVKEYGDPEAPPEPKAPPRQPMQYDSTDEQLMDDVMDSTDELTDAVYEDERLKSTPHNRRRRR
jgi:hypothetical protein